MKSNALDSHVWSDSESAPHEIIQNAKTVHHHRCVKCGRDFARELPHGDWEAAYLGAFRIEFLANSVTELWLAETCLGRIVEADVEQRRKRRS